MASTNPWLSGANFDAYRSAGWRYLGLIAVAAVLAVEIVAKAGGAGAGATTHNAASTAKLTAKVNKAVPASLLTSLEKVSKEGLSVKTGPAPISAQALVSKATGPVKGTPTLFYQGGDFCPFCAAARWPLVLALMRFGTVSGLRYMTSNPKDVYPNTPTFTFTNVSYKSSYLHFDEAEILNRTDTAYLQKPSAANNAALKKYDSTKYVGTAAGDIPFIDIADRYVWVGAPYTPKDLAKTSWTTIAHNLLGTLKTGKGNPNMQSILYIANIYTAAICGVDGQKPASVCNAAGVVAVKGALPK